MESIIQPINNINELSNVIGFLSGSFNWSQNKANIILESLITSNKLIGIYGYSIIDKYGKILGAFLLFDQGFNNNKKVKFINMSSWFVNSEARGIESLLLIKKFLNDYPDYVITNVSSNKKAYNILKAMGFKDSNIYNQKFSFFSFIFNLNLFDLRNISFLLKLNKTFLKKRLNKNNKYKTFSYLFDLESQKLEVIISHILWEKKIGFLNFKLKGLRILSTSDPCLLSKYFYKLSLFYIIKNLTFFITTHCELKELKIKPISITKQIFYFSDNKFKNENMALGSELNFI